MENFEFQESAQEKSPSDIALELLKEKGPKSQEFSEWVEKWSSAIDKLEGNTSQVQVKLSMELAILYYNAGFVDGALDSLKDNREPALGAGGDELLQQVDRLMDKMEAEEEILSGKILDFTSLEHSEKRIGMSGEEYFKAEMDLAREEDERGESSNALARLSILLNLNLEPTVQGFRSANPDEISRAEALMKEIKPRAYEQWNREGY